MNRLSRYFPFLLVSILTRLAFILLQNGLFFFLFQIPIILIVLILFILILIPKNAP